MVIAPHIDKEADVGAVAVGAGAADDEEPLRRHPRVDDISFDARDPRQPTSLPCRGSRGERAKPGGIAKQRKALSSLEKITQLDSVPCGEMPRQAVLFGRSFRAPLPGIIYRV